MDMHQNFIMKVTQICSVCNESDIDTPLVYALETLHIESNDQVFVLLMEKDPRSNGVRDNFWNGWREAYDTTAEWPSTPRGSKTMVRAWLVGFVAAFYAKEWGFKSPTCLSFEVGNHRL